MRDPEHGNDGRGAGDLDVGDQLLDQCLAGLIGAVVDDGGDRVGQPGQQGGIGSGRWAILEQARILTTHNLAAIASVPGAYAFHGNFAYHAWCFARDLRQPTPSGTSARNRLRRVAVTWQHFVFQLSRMSPEWQQKSVQRLREVTDDAGLTDSFGPAVIGLARVTDGEMFTPQGTFIAGPGRRFLGCAPEQIWKLPTRPAR